MDAVEDWIVLKALPSGGQAEAMIVQHRDGGPQRFLKRLREPGDSERRARFYREASIYRTLRHDRIPPLIATNADAFDKGDRPLYLVTEFVEGVGLDDFVQRHGRLSAEQAFRMTLRLAEVLMYAHAEDTVHRDVKPANVILRAGDPMDPVLVDFGIAFLAIDHDGHDTERGQELGNRFLRLPELSAGSADKRDPRSDLTLLSGLLLYALTGVTPRVLRDGRDHAPHAREPSAARLAGLEDVDRWRLLDFFDRAFKVSVDARWPNSMELVAALERIPRGEMQGEGLSQEEVIDRMREILAGQAEAERVEIRRALEAIVARLRASQNEVQQQLGDSIATQHGNFNYDPDQRCFRGFVGLVRASDHRGFAPEIRIQLEGPEAVISRLDADARVIGRYATQAIKTEEGPLPDFSAFLAGGMLALLEQR